MPIVLPYAGADADQVLLRSFIDDIAKLTARPQTLVNGIHDFTGGIGITLGMQEEDNDFVRACKLAQRATYDLMSSLRQYGGDEPATRVQQACIDSHRPLAGDNAYQRFLHVSNYVETSLKWLMLHERLRGVFALQAAQNLDKIDTTRITNEQARLMFPGYSLMAQRPHMAGLAYIHCKVTELACAYALRLKALDETQIAQGTHIVREHFLTHWIRPVISAPGTPADNRTSAGAQAHAAYH